MSNTTWAPARLRVSIATPSYGIGLGDGMTCVMTAHRGAVEAYKPFADARNAAQGGASAWSPPV